MKSAVTQGFTLAVSFFFIYSNYGLAFSYGTTLIIHKHATAGLILNVFLAILLGAFSLALLGPDMEGVSHLELL